MTEYGLYELLDLGRSFKREVSADRKQDLDGQALTPASLIYLKSLYAECPHYPDQVVCGTAIFNPPESLKKLFSIQDGSEHLLTASVVLGTVNETLKSTYLIAGIDNVTFWFRANENESTHRRTITQKLFKQGEKPKEKMTSTKRSSIWRNYSSVVEAIAVIQNWQETSAVACDKCPVASHKKRK